MPCTEYSLLEQNPIWHLLSSKEPPAHAQRETRVGPVPAGSLLRSFWWAYDGEVHEANVSSKQNFQHLYGLIRNVRDSRFILVSWVTIKGIQSVASKVTWLWHGPDILLGFSYTVNPALETSGFLESQPWLAQPAVNTQDMFRKRLLINKSTVPIAWLRQKTISTATCWHFVLWMLAG